MTDIDTSRRLIIPRLYDELEESIVDKQERYCRAVRRDNACEEDSYKCVDCIYDNRNLLYFNKYIIKGGC